jgi:hypothetical protein
MTDPTALASTIERARHQALELESWEMLPLSHDEVAQARALGITVPDDDTQQRLPAVRAIVRYDLAAARPASSPR